MQIFRISKSNYIRDLTGIGAKLYGGRWNPRGVSMIYTASNRALAMVEFLVHVSMGLVPNNISIATIDIPDTEVPEKLKKLPRNWNVYPASSKLQDIGSEWISSNRTLLLRVPSVVVKEEYNILINPSHCAGD